jgi:hypothetical protein
MGNAVQASKAAIEHIFNNNESRTLHETSQWLFLGIPSPPLSSRWRALLVSPSTPFPLSQPRPWPS